MAAIDDLINQIPNEQLRERIRDELERMGKRNKFGLVFENHLPECTFLHEYEIKPGRLVAKKSGPANELYKVLKIEGGEALCQRRHTEEICKFPLVDLVVAVEFGDPIYPYLKPIDSICNAPDSDLWHILIEADNYHALQLLDYLYHGQVDCIYIDPPYNTGAKDWKYNNNYVDSNDAYRHSKWLSMMEKRLKLAKRLLNPKNSVMIITVDEKEFSRLGCLLDNIFPEAQIQMVTSVIKPGGVNRKNIFSRAEEYLYFIFMGEACVYPHNSNMLQAPEKGKYQIKYESMLRRGVGSLRSNSPNLFYPVFFDINTGDFKGVGESLPLEQSRDTVKIPENCFAVWPIKSNSTGEEARWRLSQNTLLEKIKKGMVRFGPWKKGQTSRTINYFFKGIEDKIDKGELKIKGYDKDGSIILEDDQKKVTPLTVWNQPSHGAGDFGSSLLLDIFKEKRFDYPKSFYAVKDAIRMVTAGKPNALILDFFAGSGSTLHSVALLNAEDDGHRRCILVTNNEISFHESKKMEKLGYARGDKEWEEKGIARYVAWPRVKSVITGNNVHGSPLNGSYFHTNVPLSAGIETNAYYFKLGFLDRTSVSLGEEFSKLISILWLKSGGRGECPLVDPGEADREYYIFPKNGFAILPDERHFKAFKKTLSLNPEIQIVYLITNSESSYQSMASKLENLKTVQLYRDYLDNFRINHGVKP